jgi:predicted SAM-dependent methyltransferase
MTLENELLHAQDTRWLDIGSGGQFHPRFHYIDLFPIDLVPVENRSRYHRLDIVNAQPEQLEALGTFDLVRMQHTFEHWSFEDGLRVLINCARLLDPGALLLVSVPDLAIHARRYLDNSYLSSPEYRDWAWQRIPRDAPASAYFSVFAHSMTYEPHKWCYDYDGLAYQIERSGLFVNVKRLALSDDLASVPFTHNRPEEDVCVLAERA